MDGRPARSVPLTEFEKDSIRHLCLLTMKPVIYVANVAESDLAEPNSNPHVSEVINLASDLQSGLVTVSAQVSHLCCSALVLTMQLIYELLLASRDIPTRSHGTLHLVSLLGY